MQDIHDHLAPAQQTVRHVLPRTDGHASVNHSPIWKTQQLELKIVQLRKKNKSKFSTRTKRDKERQLKKS
jgi:hypothetical protein